MKMLDFEKLIEKQKLQQKGKHIIPLNILDKKDRLTAENLGFDKKACGIILAKMQRISYA